MLFSADEEITQLEKEKDFFVHEVEVISQQQKELETMVEHLEKSLGLSDYAEGEPVGIRPNEFTTNADLKRQDIYRLQVTVDAQLKQADDDINDLCEQMTELQAWKEDGSKSEDSQAAIMDQIRQILKKQLDSLNWVDQQSEELSTRVKKLTTELVSLSK
uniref:Uncharacterized protein n=1 Tax=Acrobeloides nanus TaxID=290746 RepID=A0A914CUT6_9BILA